MARYHRFPNLQKVRCRFGNAEIYGNIDFHKVMLTKNKSVQDLVIF
jgi:hypothetical protein